MPSNCLEKQGDVNGAGSQRQKSAPSFSSITHILTGYEVKGQIINLEYQDKQGRDERAGSAGGPAGRWHLACLDELLK